MAEPRAFQRNAADPKQRAYADRKVKQARTRFLNALRQVLHTPAGRIVLYQLLDDSAIWDSPIGRDADETQRRIGIQAYGHGIRAALLEADEDAYEQMEREARAYARAQDLETAAAQVSAEESAAEDGD